MKRFFINSTSSHALCLALLLTVAQNYGATVTDIAVPSVAMKKDVPVTLILPDAYTTKTARLPVLYLLHGYSGDNHAWPSQTSIAQFADQYGIIVVCPDGGYSSWYLDSPVDPTCRYETFVSSELVSNIDQSYHTLSKRESRAIAGLSMGGHGAMFLAIRHSDTFSVVSCISGGVDLRPFPDNWDIKKRIGSIQDFPDRWTAYSVITLAENLPPRKLAISIDCGVDDFFIGANRNLHQLLLRHGVPHDYTERPGMHNWDYWSNSIKFQMLFISNHLAH